MIENWEKAYKFYSVQAAVVFALLVELVLFLVPKVAEHPAFAHHAPVLLALVAFARIVSQSKKPTDPNVLMDAAARAGATLKKGSVFIALFACVGCTEPRHPERDSCYLAADQAAAQAYITECFDYPDTRSCPHGDAIEERHGAALEACK